MFKEHKKLYKAGKNWLTATLTVAAMTLLMGLGAQTAFADNVTATTTQPSQDQAVTAPAAPSQSQDQAVSVQPAAASTTNQPDAVAQSDNITTWKVNRYQWTRFNDGWSYTDGQGNWVYNQWQNINNNWYYFNNDGYAQTGWYRSGAGNWYYFDWNNAWALKGWQSINNNWYYFDPANAWADRGWFRSGAGNWYYFDWNNSWALKGWQKINNNWYYFDQNNAWALTNWQKFGNTWYYFDPTNAWMLTGWHNINGTNYYFEPSGAWNGQSSNNQQANTPGHWILYDRVNNMWQYQKADGTMAKNEWLTINGKRYYFNGSMMAHDGWNYTYPTPADADRGRHSVQYYFDEDGQIVRNRWTVYDRANNMWQYAKADGTMAKNEWLTINGKRYYFNGSMMAHDGWNYTYPTPADAKNDRHCTQYYFDENGQIVHNHWAVYDRVNDMWQYVKADGTMAKNEWLTIDGQRYHFDGEGMTARY
ncbi:KxYKxGKxW signal peptide domain-containing protein [Limosilactobacillus difficilis]|uniref:KxYKxGKxW signal peptide domain-containing protein n=1 Tax=Limosilactobacillus difficilis TaxID=2991838 RepID=UPI0024BA00F0|nr:KxYKxGKxW signal peptide domain-containing protein [Limosilactobacillus difficilis]